MLNRILIVLVLAASVGSAYAQNEPSFAQANLKQPSDLVASAAATTACQSTFTSGSAAKLLSFCVTANGNILNFTAPQGFKQQFNREGYGVCDFNDFQTSAVSYTDEAANDTGNWRSPAISQPNGPNTFPLTITRTTSDGVWQLKQTFSQNTPDRYVKVVMAVTNKSGVSRNVNLLRYMDVDADGSSTGDIFVADKFSTMGLGTVQDTANHGVVLAAVPSSILSGGFIVNAGGFDACSVAVNANPFTGDGALMYSWAFGSVAPGTTKTVTFEYRAS